MFTGLADSWWKIVKAEYKDMPDDQTWFNFKRQFGEKYIPSHIRRQRAAEFQQLVQGSMTVLEYVTKLERLSRYAPELIGTVEKKVTKFLEGLNPNIEKDATGNTTPATFEEVVKRAYKYEHFYNNIHKTQGKGQGQGQQQGLHQRNNNQNNKRPS